MEHKKNACIIVVGKPEGKKALERYKLSLFFWRDYKHKS
jgi:hypothetical protein